MPMLYPFAQPADMNGDGVEQRGCNLFASSHHYVGIVSAQIIKKAENFKSSQLFYCFKQISFFLQGKGFHDVFFKIKFDEK